MTSVTLTPDTKSRLDILFAPAEREVAQAILAAECGNTLPFLGNATPLELERVRFAALKLSNGDMARLKEAVTVAQQDWRDLLVAAGFAHDLEAHRKWMPRPGGERF